MLALASSFAACGGESPPERSPGELAAALASPPPAKTSVTSGSVEAASWRLVSAPEILFGQSATALDDGTLLLVGGEKPDGSYETTGATHVFNPVDDTFSPLPTLHDSREGHFAVKLLDGRVLVGGGRHDESNSSSWLASSEIFDPATSTWTKTPDLPWPPFAARAIRLQDGRVLAVGGESDGPSDASLIFDPEAGTSGAWDQTAPLPAGRDGHALVLLQDGTVLSTGGEAAFSYATDEVFAWTAGDWSLHSWLSYPRSRHTATVLADGRVLIVGGLSPNGMPTGIVEILDPDNGETIEVASLIFERAYHTATLLPDGRVIVIGGSGYNGQLTSTEIYDPVQDTWSLGPQLNLAREGHSMAWVGSRLVVVGTGWVIDPIFLKHPASVRHLSELSTLSDPTAVSSLEILDLGGPIGASCSEDAECDSNFCVDGVCCDTACEGACVACTAELKGWGEDGTCGAVVEGTNPRSLCEDEGAASCGTTGVCDASGNCAVYEDGTSCGDGMSCQAGACVSGSPCFGKSDGTECGEGKVCQAGECVAAPADCAEQPDGAICAEGGGCTVGICRDGDCVETYKLDGTRCEGGVCIAGECRLDREATPPSGAGGQGTGSGGEDPSGQDPDGRGASGDADGDEGGGGCSLAPSGSGSSTFATSFALLAAIGLLRGRRSIGS